MSDISDISLDALDRASLVALKDGQREHLIEELSTLFTQKRHLLDNYVQSPELISAYTQFYFVSNGKKLTFLLEQLPFSIVEDLKRCSLIDFGCGPGTYGLAWWNFFKESVEHIWEVDRAPLMLEQSKKIVQHFAEDNKFSWVRSISEIKKDGPICLLFGNSMNEMSEDDLLKVISSVDADYLIFIEPGTKDVFARMKVVRELLIEKNSFSILYPCLGSSQCPMTGDNWCHQIVRAQYSQDYESLCQRVKRDRRNLPVSLYMFKKTAVTDKGKEISECVRARVIRLFQETKYSLIFEVCLEKDEKNILLKVEILKKEYKKRQLKKLIKFDHGRHFYYQYKKQKAEDWWVITLIGDCIDDEA